MVGNPYQPQGVDCPVCGRHVALLIDGTPAAHTDPRTYDRPCTGKVTT